MLTNKQIWRRCVSYNFKKKENYYMTGNYNYYMTGTNNYLLSNKIENNRKEKKLQFCSLVKVILIPALSDYLPNMKRLLWYDDDDYLYFKQEFLKNKE